MSAVVAVAILLAACVLAVGLGVLVGRIADNRDREVPTDEEEPW